MSSEISYGMLDGLVGYHLRRAQAKIFSDLMETFAEDQVTPGQFGVLVLIDTNTGLSQSSLARALGIERSTMVGVIDTLEKRDLVKRLKSQTDKRAHALELTSKGLALLNTVKPKVTAHEKRMVSGLREGEIKTLLELLKRLRPDV